MCTPPDADADDASGGPDEVDDPDEPGRRAWRLVELVRDDETGDGSTSGVWNRLARVCAAAVTRAAVDGAGVTVMSSLERGRAGHRDQLAACGPLTRRLEELQLTTGEGPCLDAHATGFPVLAGNLAAELSRWPGFGPEALAAGAAAVFSLPLQIGAVRLGTLDLYRTRAEPLSPEQLADALVLAGLATESLLHLTEHPDSADGGAPEPATGEGRQPRPAGWLPEVHADVHVASGMVSARAGVDVATALLRIRAHAFGSGERISDVARRIVDRELVLDTLGTDHHPHDRPDPADSSHTDSPDAAPDTDTEADP